MPASTPVNTSDPGLEVRTFFVRNRNALLAKADFGPLFVDFFLHLSDQKIQLKAEQSDLFKRALAGFVLHCASRPWNELIAWTIHFEELKTNLFLAGDNQEGTVTGRLFDEDVKEMGGNFFYADVIRGNQPKRRSVAEFSGDDPLAAIEAFYRVSEQRGAKLMALREEEYAIFTEHPDLDKAWFEALDLEQAKTLETRETVAPMERRIYRWHCGCNEGRMLEVLAPMFREDPEGLFGADPKLEIRCPRCAARHIVTRESLEAFVAGEKKP